MALSKKIVIAVPLIATISIVVFFSRISQDIQIESPLEKEEKLVPKLDFHLPNGQRVSLHDFQGRSVLMNFWATWCEPCLEEMPSLKALEKNYRSHGLTVLAINIEETPESDLRDKLTGLELPSNLIFNVKRSQISHYKLEGIPYTIFINREGRPVKNFEGPRDWASPEMFKLIDQLLAR
ncbi:TlpA family protein disulfide reductase [bacterium]|nr:TlpA family protein disulfide reductase [bacterium]